MAKQKSDTKATAAKTTTKTKTKDEGQAKGEKLKGGAEPEKSDYRAFFLRWKPVAYELVGDNPTRTLKRDARVLLANCLGAHRAMRDRGITDAVIAEHLPKIDRARVWAVVEIAKALVFATGRVPSAEASDGEIELRVARISPIREQTLSTAETLAARKKLPAARVRAIREGSGRGDMANDAVQLAALYEEFFDVLRGAHDFKREELAAMGEDGQWLLEHLGTDAKGEELAAKKPAPEARDRDVLLALLDAYYREVLRVAGYFSPENPALIATKLRSQSVSGREEDDGEEGGGGGEGGGGAGGAGEKGAGEKGGKEPKPAPK